MNNLPAIGLGALTMALLVLLRSAIRLHQRRLREQERLDLHALAESRALSVQEQRLPPSLLDLAAGLGGRGRDAGLLDVLRGADDLGSWYLCRRRLGDEVQQGFLFENKLLTLSGLRVSPMRERVSRWSALLRRVRRESAPPFALRMEWVCEAARVDERSVLMAQALYLLMAQAREVVEPMSIHLQVEDQRIAIHTHRPLTGDALRVFTDVAIELRRLVIDLPRSSGALRLSPGESGRFKPVEGEITRALAMAPMPTDGSGASLPYGSMETKDKKPVVSVPTAT